MRKLFKKVVCIVFAMAMVCAVAIGMVACDKTPVIAVVAKGETHAFWQSVKSGAEAAGKKYGYKITFKGPTAESEEYVPNQREFVTQALNNANTKALVLATIGTGFVDELFPPMTRVSPSSNSTAVCTTTAPTSRPGKTPRSHP